MSKTNVRSIRGEVLIEIHSFKETEIPFAGTTLILSDPLKKSIHGGSDADMTDLFQSLKKGGFKDGNAMRDYMREIGRMARPNEDDNDYTANTVTRRGIVANLPLRRNNFGNWDFFCESGLNVGDYVWFDPFYVREQLEKTGDSTSFKENGKIYVYVPEQAIFAAKRGEDHVPINGYFLGKRLPNDHFIGSILMLDKKIAKIKVTHVPSVQPVFRMPDVWKNTNLKIGDVVYVSEEFATPLDSTLAESTDLVRFQSRIVLAIEND